MSPEELEKPKGENKEKFKAKVICIRCSKDMGEVEWPREGEVTYNICPECFKKRFSEIDKEKESK